MGNTRPLGMASDRAAASWCSHCGAGLPAPPGFSGPGGVRCALCHRVTRIERQLQRGVVSRGAVAFSRASPPRPAVSLQRELPAGYPRVAGKKRALLVAVSYTGTEHELRGTVNDLREMRRLLVGSFGFPTGCILELTEKESEACRVPTRENVLLAMRWLVEGCSAGDSLVFHFSGHGVQKLDTHGDEVDGYNEALCPVDFERSGKILDDEINDTIVRPLGRGVKLHAIVDTCHSGTILDLPYLCRLSRTGYWQWENHCVVSGAAKRPTAGGLAVSVSGCNDHQKSVDSCGFAESEPIGAMTESFIRAVEAEPGITYGRLLCAIRARIRDGQGRPRRLPGRLGSFMRQMVASSSSVQEPQLCSSEVFDIYKKPFLL